MTLDQLSGGRFELEYVAAGAHGINVALRAPIDQSALAGYLAEVVPAVRRAGG